MATELDWEFVKAQLPAGWRELAVERGLIHPLPPQLHAKVTDIEQVLRIGVGRRRVCCGRWVGGCAFEAGGAELTVHRPRMGPRGFNSSAAG